MKIPLRHLTYLLLLGVLTFTLASACSLNVQHSVTSSKQPTESCRKVQHEMGETCIPLNPQRVITLWTTILGNTLALDIKPFASTYITSEPLPEYLQKQADGVKSVGNFTEPNLEKILLFKPDLILANSRLQNIYQQLSYIAPTVIMKFPAPPPPWKQQFTQLVNVLDREEAGKRLMSEYYQRIEKLKEALGDRRHKLQVSVVGMYQDNQIVPYGERYPASTVIKDIGLQRPSGQRGDFYYTNSISEEQLSNIDADVLFFLVRREKGANEFLEKLQQKPLWRQLKVVQKNQVYFVDGGNWGGFDILAMNAVIDDLFKYLVNPP
ncbi:iron-siderophore ABC transporter substrate-binding protein [Nostoc sp.]|uniref:iron-siderophore ABC transporter substrate-binding protein n=1 Tax=Nostoc sp. TaxID=1180 RepID=UPI002FFC7B75